MNSESSQDGGPTSRSAVRNGIITGVVTSLIASAIFAAWGEPGMKFLARIATSFSQSYVDSAYAEAAVDPGTILLFQILQQMLGIGTGLAVGYLVTLNAPTAIRRVAIGQQTAAPASLKRRGSFFRLVLSVCVAFVMLSFFHPLLKSWISVNAHISYERRMMALSGCENILGDSEIRSTWANVQSKSEYKRVMQMIETRASACGVDLPRDYLAPGGTSKQAVPL